MERCDTCRHWRPIEKEQYGECMCIRHETASSPDDPTPESPDDFAWIWAEAMINIPAQGYWVPTGEYAISHDVSLITRPMFGCALHTEKDDA